MTEDGVPAQNRLSDKGQGTNSRLGQLAFGILDPVLIQPFPWFRSALRHSGERRHRFKRHQRQKYIAALRAVRDVPRRNPKKQKQIGRVVVKRGSPKKQKSRQQAEGRTPEPGTWDLPPPRSSAPALEIDFRHRDTLYTVHVLSPRYSNESI